MLGLLLHWLVSALALFLTAALVPGFRLRGFGSAMIASVAIGVANILVRPILLLLSLPLTLLTFGLFLFVIDAIILRLCAGLLRNFEITNWLSALLGACVLALCSSLLHFFLPY